MVTLMAIVHAGADVVSTAYGKAQLICSQAITNVRTVVSFSNEETLVESYATALVEPSKMGIKVGVAQGLASGSLNGVVFLTCDPCTSDFVFNFSF